MMLRNSGQCALEPHDVISEMTEEVCRRFSSVLADRGRGSLVFDFMFTTESKVDPSTMRLQWRHRTGYLRLIFLVIYLVNLQHMISKADAALDPNQEKVLKVLQETISLPTWTGDPCGATWISCSNTTPQNVVSLLLSQRNLTGIIPPDISQLRNISRIDFNTNHLSGEIPEISNMTNLTVLYLWENRLTGGVPASLFQQKSLVDLDLHANLLNGTVPKSLENMTQVKIINLRSNLFEGPLPDLRALVNLEQFDASRNGFVGPFPDIKNLRNLIGLSVAHNFLSGPIPPSVFQSSNLQWLIFSNNSFDPGPIPDMSRLTGLVNIRAVLCNFQGPIPSLENNKLLQELSVQINNLTSIPSDLRNLTRLTLVNVRNNIISGTLPDLPAADTQTFTDFQTPLVLTIAEFSNNNFTGRIPESWAQLRFLQTMHLGNNKLSGVIPKEIGNLVSLSKLNLSSNFFSGPIPEEISLLGNLKILDLRNNQLTGTVPESLVNLPNLQVLYLDDNNFTGIPEALATKAGLNITFGNTKIISSNGDGSGGLAPGVIVGISIGALCAGIFVLAVIVLWTKLGRRKHKNQLSRDDMPKSARAFSWNQIKAMTQNFKRQIGKGGFGPVYYGILPSKEEVAVKVRATYSKQGAREFLNEVQLLSRLHHRNLVPLVGYCLDREEQILIYSYMQQGTLHDRLHHLSGSTTFLKNETCDSTHKPLDWKTRLHIVLDSARGLEYLHKDCNPPVIHRDVKSSNILLTDKLEAKLGDLGISKQAPEPDRVAEESLDKSMTGISTAVRGTLGYMDPEYFTRRKLSTKSDVYSFGVILLEIITGKRAQSEVFPSSDATTLHQWVECAVSGNNLKSIVDPTLKGDYNDKGMLMVARTALSCLLPSGVERPEMRDIVRTLTDAIHMEKILRAETPEIPDQDSEEITGQVSDQFNIPQDLESIPSSSSGYTANTRPDSTLDWNMTPR